MGTMNDSRLERGKDAWQCAGLIFCALVAMLLQSCVPPGRVVGSDRPHSSSIERSRTMDQIEDLLRQGLFSEAQEAVSQALEDGYRHPRLWYLMARVDMANEAYEEALEHLHAAINAAPRWPQPRLLQAQAYLALQRTSSAQASFRSLQDLFPHHPAGPYGRGYVAMLREDYRVAQAAFAEALERDQHFTPAIAARAHIARMQGDRDLERRLLNRYRSLEPQVASAHRRLAELDAEDGLLESARRGFERAYRLQPNANTASELADLARQQGDEERAAYWQERASERR
ncbi:MAG: hypothetical protein EA401_06345 [Planctomycetota bacterium]|nr:MAG: hypothetical protein EA401_06345 [Planctomycetota bacterium]